MTQSEFDAEMIEIRRQQNEMHREYDAKQQELADQVRDIDLQILELKKKIVCINREKNRVAAERFRLDMEFKQRKGEFVVDHPKSSMEPEKAAAETFGHVVMDEDANVAV